VFEMKKEMDATKWGDILAEKLKDWWVGGALGVHWGRTVGALLFVAVIDAAGSTLPIMLAI